MVKKHGSDVQKQEAAGGEKDGPGEDGAPELTREERRKAKKERKRQQRKALAEAEEQRADDAEKRDEHEGGSSGGEWEQAGKKKKKKKVEPGQILGGEAGGSKKRKRDGDGADGERKTGPLELTWLTPTPRPPLSVAMVRDLVLHLVGGEAQPSWVRVEGAAPPVTVVVLADYLGHDSYTKEGHLYPFLSSLKRNSAVLRAPGTQLEVFPTAADLCTCPLEKSIRKTQVQKEKKAKKSGASNVRESKTAGGEQEDVIYPVDLLLNEEELMENKYPCCGSTGESTMETLPEGYRRTRQAVRQAERRENSQCSGLGKMIALDCEMCTTKEGLELTRISMVDEGCKVVYDTFVKPDNEILDYNTRFSGITAETLMGIETTLEQVQEKMLELCDEDTILVGHSLENDLRACKLVHTRIIDTAVIYPHHKGPPYKNALRYLVSKFLRREMERSTGHCSVDDASACMQLVRLKVRS